MAFVFDTFKENLEKDKSTAGNAALPKWTEIVGRLRKQPIDVPGLQIELDALDVSAARAYRTALKYLIDEIPGTCYSGVYSIDGEVIVDGTYGIFNGYGAYLPNPNGNAYTSPMFKASANIYCVGSARDPFEVGFIQQCTSKSQEAVYGNVKRQEWYTTFNFPVGDCASPGCVPFYHRSNSASHGCYMSTRCVWRIDGSPGTGHDCQMTDYFNMNTFNARYFHGNNQQAWSTGFSRSQGFTCWLARRMCGVNSVPRLFYVAKYVLALQIVLNGQPAPNHQATAVTTTGTQCDSFKRLYAFDTLPIVTNNIMNGMDQFRWVD